jgi:hypothetical protein
MNRFQKLYTKQGKPCRFLPAPKTLEKELLLGQWALNEACSKMTSKKNKS